MKVLFLIFISFLQIFAFELSYNTGREENQAFGVLHISNDLEFTCQSYVNETKLNFVCEFNGAINNKLKDQSFAEFDLKFTQEEQKIKLFILPKIHARMFDTFQNIYQDKELSPSNSHKSKAFTFIFTKDELTSKVYDGLDFKIIFPHESMPYVKALDLNSNPVIIPQSADINTYLRIKNEFEKANYAQVETDAQNAINRYKGSIFLNEFMLYKLRAQEKLYTQDSSIRDEKILEQMIEDTKNWARTFTSDKNFAEVLYIRLKTYMSLTQRKEVEYTMSILNAEQPNSYFTELARLDYADYIYNLDEKENAVNIYENIYLNTKELDIASRAAMSLAKNLLLNSKTNEALAYINTIFKANPSYFGKDSTKALELAKLLRDNKEFELSARIYEDTFSKMSKLDLNYEEALKDLALTLASTSRANDAKKYIDTYMNDFLDGKYLDDIKKASDEVFFSLQDENASFLHEKFQSLAKEYAENDENLANKAIEEDIKLYYKEGNLNAILAYKNEVESKNLPNAKKVLEQAAINELEKELQNDNCISAVSIFTDFSSYDLGQKIEDKKQMLNCLIRTSNTNQALDYIAKNRNEDFIFYNLKEAEILFNNKQYNQVIALCKDIISAKILKSEAENFRAFYLQFFSLLRLDEYNEAIKILKILEDFPMEFSMVEAYDALLTYANDKNMQESILSYAPKAINYQNLLGINLFSPNLEFIYLDALAKANNNDESLAVLTDLLKLRLSDENKARAFYLQALTYERMQNLQAQKQSLQECINLTNPSNWQDLCKSKNTLLN